MNKCYDEMWSMFDKIVCIHFLPYEDRMPDLKNELKRVGILDLPQFEFEYTVPTKMFDYLRFPKGTRGDKLSGKAIPLAIQFFTLVKKMYMLGYEKVLFLEDDVVFHKDIEFIRKILKETPKDWDIVNYDPWRRKGWLGNGKGFWGHYYDLNGNEVDKDWDDEMFVRYHSVVYRNTAVAMSRKAMKQYIEKSEQCLLYADGYTWKDTGDLNTYCTTGNNSLCIQHFYDNRITNGEEDTVDRIYKGYDMNNYGLNQLSENMADFSNFKMDDV